MPQYDSRVDAYIEKSADFAKPILKHIRNVVHGASPLVTENIKWGMPFFEYKGAVCQMAAFKQHCAFGFWKAGRLHDPHHLLNPGVEAAAGSFGRIHQLCDLPKDDVLNDFVLQAMQLNDSGEKVSKPKPPTAKKNELVIPADFSDILEQNPKAKEAFEKLSPSHKKEYVQWFVEAKTEATRAKRMQQALEMMGEGKSRNWKYKQVPDR